MLRCSIRCIVGYLTGAVLIFTLYVSRQQLYYYSSPSSLSSYASPSSWMRLLHNVSANWPEESPQEKDSSYLCSKNERLSVLLEHCQLANASTKYDLTRRTKDHIFVDDKHKIMGCLVTKAACSTWKIIMLNSTGKVNVSKLDHLRHVHNPAFWKTVGLHRLSDYSQDEVAYRLDNYFKFISVRHPFDRLASAYGDKIVPHVPRYGNGHIAKMIVKKYRPNATADALANAMDVTFKEFVTYLLDTNPHRYDRHWQLYEDMCDPCRVDYHYVSRLETLSDDSKVIVPKFALNAGVNLPVRNAFGQSTQYTLEQGKYLSIFDSLSADQIKGLQQVYRREFEMFGYSWENGNVAKCYNKINDRECC